jgi:radical SAM superfamily enzyme YgiQ (UPF0313 family)
MAAAGCKQMSIGVESGVDSILRYIGKGETTSDYIRAAESLNKHGVVWKAYCIIGFPEETQEDILETVRFVKNLGPARITLSLFTPYLGTPLYEECLERGLLRRSETDLFHQGPTNFFSTTMTQKEFYTLRDRVSAEVDAYNTAALSTWT